MGYILTMQVVRIGKLLRSIRMTIALLLGVAIVAAAGTLYTPAEARSFLIALGGEPAVAAGETLGLVDVYKGTLFVSLQFLIVINILLCTLHRLPLRSALSVNYPGSTRRRWTVLLDAGMHISLLFVISGAATKALYGFVGTKNMYVGVAEDKIFDWRAGGDVPLGLEVLVEGLGKFYFPTLAKIGVVETATARPVELITVKEGARTDLAGGSLAVQSLTYLESGSAIELVVLEGGRAARYQFSVVSQKQEKVYTGRYTLTLVAWRRDLREVVGKVAIRERGRTVLEEQLRVNGRMSYRGWNVFLTGWGRDEFGNDFAGIQMTREPGSILFWAGAVLFSVCLPAFVLLRHGIDSRDAAPAAS